MRRVAVSLAAIGLVAGLVMAPPVAASEPSYSPAFQACLDSDEGMSTHGQIGCIGAELERQDQRLNAAYRQAMARLNPRQQGALRTAQRAWIAFRDADCASLTDADWGTLSRVSANFCMLRMTAERADHLQSYPEN